MKRSALLLSLVTAFTVLAPAKKRVLILGDSISIGCTLKGCEALAGEVVKVVRAY